MKSIFNKIAIILIAIFLLLMNVPPKTAWNDLLENEKVQAAAPSKPTGSSGSYLVNVTAESVKANPSVYWNQLDDLSFEATKDGGKVTSQNSGNNTPNEKEVKNTIDLTQYNLPSSFQDENRQKFSRAALTKMYLKNDSVKFYSQARSFKGISLTKNSDTKFVFVTKTGAPNIETEKKQYGKNKKGQPKYTVRYDTPVDIKWYGEVLMQAEVRVVEDSKMVVGQKKNFKLQLRTKEGALPWTSWNDTAAATWSSDKSSVASVNSTGQVTASAKGQAKISATWKKNDYHLIASANVTVTAEDALSVTGKLDACFKDGSTTLKATLYQAGGKSSDVTSTATWTSSDTSVATVSKGVVTFKKVGTTTIKVTSNGKTESVKVTIVDCTIVPLPTPTDPSEPPPPPPPVNEPPVVEIKGKLIVTIGENVCYNADASDPDGFVESYFWYWENGNFDTDNVESNTLCGKFEDLGKKIMTVYVTDNGDENGLNQKAGSDTVEIEVIAPKPTAYVDVTGTMKENRKIDATPSDAYGGNALAHKSLPIVKQTLTIEPVDSSNKGKILIDGDISGNNVDHKSTYAFLAKFSGEVKITRYVENSKGDNDTFETIINVIADEKPIAEFDTPTLVYREADENNAASTNIEVYDRSYSLDDAIQKRIYRLKYDSNNDGNFDDEQWQVISDTNEKFVSYNTSKVGKYLIELEVWEKFGQPTIEKFVNLTFDKDVTDLRSNDTAAKTTEQKVVEVDNLPPVVSMDLKEKNVAEIQFDTINSPFPKHVLQSNLPYLKNLLSKENIELKLADTEITGKVVQMQSNLAGTLLLLDTGEVYEISNAAYWNRLTQSTNNLPQKVVLPFKVKQIFYQGSSAHFLSEDNILYGYGDNTNGILGDGTNIDRQTPTKVLTNVFPAKVADIIYYNFRAYYLLENGDIYYTNSTNYQFSIVPNVPKNVKQIAFKEPTKNENYSWNLDFYVLTEDGNVHYSDLNKNLGTVSNFELVETPSIKSKIIQIESSYNEVQALTEDGNVYSFDSKTKYTKKDFTFKVSALADYNILGSVYTRHYISNDGAIYAYGYNHFGAVGDGTSIEKITPVRVDLPSTVVQVTGSSNSTHYRLADGSLYGSGLKVGDGTDLTRLSPVKIDAFERKTIFNDTQSTLFAVGLNQQGSLDYYKKSLANVSDAHFIGGGTSANKTTLENVVSWNEGRGQFIGITPTNSNENIQKFYDKLAEYIILVMGKKQVDVQYDAIDSPYSEAQLKSMTPLLNSLLNDYGLKANVSFMSNSVSKTISSGYGSTHFITRDGSVYATGRNYRGQLGDGTTIDRKTPVKLNLSNVVQVSPGFQSTHFLTKDGYVYATGYNDAGKLGLTHSEMFISTPEKVNISNVIQISSGSTHTYFLTKDGDVYVVGSNYYGQAGIGNRTITYGIEKLNIPKVKQIASQEDTTHFLLQSGDVMATGRNESIYGFIGDGRNENVYTPKTIITGDVAQISSGYSFTHFIMNDGSVYATGYNVSGQLGDGTTVTKRNYVKLDLLNVAQISSGRNSTLFLLNDGSSYVSGISTVSGINTLYGTPTKIDIPNVLEVSTGYVGVDTWHLLLQDGSIFAAGNNEYGQIGDDTTSNKTVLTKIGFTNPPKNTVKFKTSQNPVYMAFISNKNESYEDLVTKKNNVEGYFIGATKASNKAEIDKLIKANGNKGMHYDIGSTYNDTNLETYIRDFANYIIETQSENSIEVEVLLDSASGIDTAVLQSKLDTTFKELIAPDETIIDYVEQADGTYKEVESIVPSTNVLRTRIKTLDNKYNFENTHLDGTNRFVVALKTNAYTADVQKHITAANLVNNAYFIGLGKSANKITIDNVVNASMKKGTYLEFTNVDDAITDLANYILTTIEKNRGIKELFVTTDDEVNYFATYSDYENDPKFNDYWKMKHERGFFESENGTIPNNDAKVSSPIKQFDYTGRYQPKYAAQDDPLTRYTAAEIAFFEDYRKWSDEADNWRIFVHKAPSSDFAFTLNSTTGAYTVTNKAMDSDKASIDVGYGAGLQAQSFTWKLENDADWQDGLPSGTLVANQTYQIRNTVIDLQGKKSETIKLLSRQNLPPVALFKTDKQTYSKNEDVLITNTSYDPNSDNLTATWTYKYKHNDDSTYKALMTGALTGEKANAGWNPTLAKVACEPSDKNKTCTVVIQLVVTDIHGLSDSTTREITINNSNKPIADFETDKLVYEQEENVIITNKSTDDDNDDMTATWSIKPKDGGSYQQFATGEFKDGKALTGWHPTIPNIKCDENDTSDSCYFVIKLHIADAKGETDETTREIEVINNKPPVAKFVTDKAQYKYKETVIITNDSYDVDNDDLKAVWFIKGRNDVDGSYTQFATGELKNGTADSGWNPSIKDIACKANDTNPTCHYTIKLVVTDIKGKTDEATRTIEVINNKPPVAKFDTNKSLYEYKEDVLITNRSTDADNDNLTATWYIKEKGKADNTYKEFATGEFKNGAALTGWNPTISEIVCPTGLTTEKCSFIIKLVVKDVTNLTDEATKEIEVYNRLPQELETASKKVDGQFYWELKRYTANDPTNIRIHAEPSILSEHIAVRNIKYGYTVSGRNDLSVTRTATNASEVLGIDTRISTISDVTSLQGKKITYFVEYEYTNHYLTRFDEKIPLWDDEYVETFELAKEVPNNADDLTLTIDHVINKRFDFTALNDSQVQKGFIVGRDVVVKVDDTVANNTDIVTKQEYREQLVTDSTYKPTYELKSQTRLPIALQNMAYHVQVPSKEQHLQLYAAFREGNSKGTYTTIDIDDNLRNMYEKGGKYELPLVQTNIQKQPLATTQTIQDKATYKFDYLTDLFLVSKNTGFIHAKRYANEKSSFDATATTWEQILTQGDNEMDLVYNQVVGVDYLDSVITKTLEETQYYYLPVSLTSRYKPNNNYKNEYQLKDIGLNEVTINFEQRFKFENYLFGDILDEPIFTEQQVTPIAVASYPHKVTLNTEKLHKVIQYGFNKDVTVHEFRFADRSVIEGIKQLLN